MDFNSRLRMRKIHETGQIEFRDSNLIDIKIFGLFQLAARATVSSFIATVKHAYPEI